MSATVIAPHVVTVDAVLRPPLPWTRIRNTRPANQFEPADPSAGKGEVHVMEVMHPRCAGIDVSKRDAKVCKN